MATIKKNEHIVDERMRKVIAGAVAEIDPAQIAVLRQMTTAQRFAQMLSMLNFTEIAAADRLCLREQTLSERNALQIVRSGTMMQWALEYRKQKQDPRNDRRTT